MPKMNKKKMSTRGTYDVVVIGGGPAGSALGILLSRRGYSVLILEREKFPRFHVGESLIPSTQAIFERLGIAEALQHQGHTFKYAGEFRIGRNPASSTFESTISRFNNTPRSHRMERPFAYHVVRSEFDDFLLKEARRRGADVVEEARVREVLWDGDRATGVRWTGPEGEEHTTSASMVADCSGRHALISRSLKLLQADKRIQTSSVFCHYKHVKRDPGSAQGYFNGYFFENGWMWFIPLKNDVMSVGVVVNRPGTDWWGRKKPEEILHTYINRYRFLRDRFEHAEQYSKARILRGLPYRSSKCVGDGWILVGDSNFFVDPLYSSGIEVTFHSAEKAFEAIDGFLSSRRMMAPLNAYQRWAKVYSAHIFMHMSLIYRLLRYRKAIEIPVKLTGRLGNNWETWFLRRVNTFSIGYFEDFHPFLYAVWPHMYLLSQACRVLTKLKGEAPWESDKIFCSLPPLEIPKAEGFPNEPESTRRKHALQDDVRPSMGSGAWILPLDNVDDVGRNGRPLMQ